MAAPTRPDFAHVTTLLERLWEVNPRRFDEVVGVLREMVESQELLARAPTILRAPARYLRRRYLA